MDSNERALMVAMGTDFYYCLYCPALVLYACPSVRRSFRTVVGIRRGQAFSLLKVPTNAFTFKNQ